MADDTNEDSWLYGTSNPDSTTNEENVDAAAAGAGADKSAPLLSLKSENEAVAAASAGDSALLGKVEAEPEDAAAPFGEFEDPAQEMEEDEDAAVAVAAASGAANTTDADDGAGAEGSPEQQQQQQQSKSSDSGGDNSDDDSDDDINVVIGDIKAAPSTYNIKQRSNLLAGAGGAGQEKSKSGTQAGKFSVEDFEGVGTINGVPAHEFSIDSLEDKPWRKPGADITDYFNYGFNEETWRAYCERQKRFRVQESGVRSGIVRKSSSRPVEKKS